MPLVKGNAAKTKEGFSKNVETEMNSDSLKKKFQGSPTTPSDEELLGNLSIDDLPDILQ